jgi:hypothetical protein
MSSVRPTLVNPIFARGADTCLQNTAHSAAKVTKGRDVPERLLGELARWIMRKSLKYRAHGGFTPFRSVGIPGVGNLDCPRLKHEVGIS